MQLVAINYLNKGYYGGGTMCYLNESSFSLFLNYIKDGED